MKCISLFKCNPQIEIIDKSHCSLEDVPNFQNYQRSLEELFLDANKLTVLNDNLFKLTKLRRFSFSDNAIQEIPPDIAKLVNLVELDGSRNKIQILPEQIKFLRGLQVCDFSANNIETLPNGLVQLKNLTCLTLNYCPIKNLPDDFGSLKSLESLELRENELETLPASISALENLKKLDLGRNLLSKLPDDIGRLVSLEYLLVDGNRLETVPPKIGRLQNLQCLDLGQQEYGLKYLPEEISGLTSLTDFHLSENHLQSLPDGIGNLKNLTIFKADNNYLSELNSNIGGCVSLQELVLTSNQITKLPSTIGNLIDLRSMNVDSNFLKELTPQIGNLKRLGILSLRDNLLTYLPNEIGQLNMVQVMDVSGNRLECLPISITAINLKALWLSKNQAQPLPKLQIDELPGSGTKVLTCYLLPQQSDTEDDNIEALAAQQSTEPDDYTEHQPAAVTFNAPAGHDAEYNDAQLVRHDTPHPRELRARHQKLFTNTAQQPAKTNDLRGHDNASFSLADNAPSNSMTAYTSESVAQPAHMHSSHLDYESNGLPEVPMSQPSRASSHVTPKYSQQEILEQSKNYNPETRTSNGYVKSQVQDREQQSLVYNTTLNTTPAGYATKRPTSNDYESGQQLDEPQKCHVLDIMVRRSKNHRPGLGLSIAGGKDTPPYKDDDEGIFVSKVTRYGPAEAAGVREGDKILAVNDIIFHEGISHQRAVEIFKRVKPDFLMRVLRDPNDEYPDDDEEDEDDTVQPQQQQQQQQKSPKSRHDDAYVTSKDKRDVISSSRQSIEETKSTFSRTYTIPEPTTNGKDTSTISNLRQFLMNKDAHNAQEKPVQQSSLTTRAASTTLPRGMSLIDGTPSKSSIIYTTLVKNYKNDLGLVLENRNDDGNSQSNWANIVVADIKPNSLAAMDGKLRVDDRLLSINGLDVTGVDLERVLLMLEGTERFLRMVVSRGDNDDPVNQALKNMPVRPSLGSWFSSTSNMAHRPSLIESYQRPTFGSVTSLQRHQPLVGVSKPPKPPKPTHLFIKDSIDSADETQTPSPQAQSPEGISHTNLKSGARGAGTQLNAADRRAWRQERLKSIEDDVAMAKAIAEAERRRAEDLKRRAGDN